ncbi:MAG: type II secretion system protein GspD [Phycisphaerae bacterium]
MKRSSAILLALALCCFPALLGLSAPALSDNQFPSTAPSGVPNTGTSPSGAGDDWIQLNLPPTVELKVLIEYVSKRLNMNIIYEESVGAAKVAMLSPNRIRKDELVGLLKDVLKMSGLELVDTPLANWKTIGRKALVRFVAVKNLNAADLAKRVSGIIEERQRIGGGAGRLAAPRVAGPPGPAPAIAPAGSEVTLVPDPKTNQIAVIATESEMAGTLSLIDSLDVSPNVETRTYRFVHISPLRIDSFMKSRVAGEVPEATYVSTIDEPSGLMMVTARGSTHKLIEMLAREWDKEGDTTRSSIQFYKLINTTAADVLATIRSLQKGAAKSEEKAGPTAAGAQGPAPGMTGPITPVLPPATPPGPNIPSSPGLATVPPPPSYSDTPASQPGAAPPPGAAVNALGQGAIVAADTNTNQIIVVAPPDVQRAFKQLITALDKRRPQVLVEVTLVTLDTTNNFSLGVELGYSKITRKDSLILFSSFGLSKVDPATGIPTLIPSTGFNGILLDPDALNVVVHAVASNSRAKVLSAPKILTNDNATGKLASTADAPFTSVNASATVSTTSFAGYESAGTTVTVIPHISQGDYLQLKYTVELSSFTGSATDVAPPPRTRDLIDSEVTIPNGYAIVVGGLSRKDTSRGKNKVPILGDIPVLGYLFGVESDKDTRSTLFVFIRPVILRDDQFEDLKYLSDRDLAAAQLPPNFPASEMMVVR